MAGATWIVFRFTTSAMPYVTRHTSHASQLESPMLRGMMFRMPGSGGLRGPSMPMQHMHHLGYPHGLQSMHEMQLQQVQPLLPSPTLYNIRPNPSLCSITPCKMPHQTPSRLLFPCHCRLSPESLKSPLSRFGGGVGVLASVTVLLRSKLIAGTTQMATRPPRQEEPQAPPPHPFLNFKPLTIFRRP
jgi:hypothetical protein